MKPFWLVIPPNLSTPQPILLSQSIVWSGKEDCSEAFLDSDPPNFSTQTKVLPDKESQCLNAEPPPIGMPVREHNLSRYLSNPKAIPCKHFVQVHLSACLQLL